MSMYDYAGWRKVGCVESDEAREAQPVTVESSLTDLSGQFGTPVMFTEWWSQEGNKPISRDYYWHPHSDAGTCVHYVWEGIA